MPGTAASSGHAWLGTRIVATLGPSCETPAMVEALAEAGVDLFRLNLAHGSTEWHGRMIQTVRAVESQLQRPLGILVDLPGPKLRLGPLRVSPLACKAGELFRVLWHGEPQSTYEVTLSVPAVAQSLQDGDRLLLADGTVSWRVVGREEGAARCVVEKPGDIHSRSGVHIVGHTAQLPVPTAEDVNLLDRVPLSEVDFIGLSFTSGPDDIERLRAELARRNCAARIVAKIERASALGRLSEILRVTDAVMVARGDLGVEVDIARVALVQKEILQAARPHRVPVITATQMLESMRTSVVPTRAEATDVANAVLDGTDALMLSGETAIGQHPVWVVQTMRRIAAEAESWLRDRAALRAALQPPEPDQPLTALTDAAARMAEQLQARWLIVTTRHGQTAFALSKERCFVPTLALTNNRSTWRALTLCWGAQPVLLPAWASLPELLDQLPHLLEPRGPLQSGERLVVLSSTHHASSRYRTLLLHEAP
jgi:pyruvate kinase